MHWHLKSGGAFGDYGSCQHPLNALQLITFYTMEKRADQVGQHGVYAMLRMILQINAARAARRRSIYSPCSYLRSVLRL